MWRWRRRTESVATPENEQYCWKGKGITIPPSPSGFRALHSENCIRSDFEDINQCRCEKCKDVHYFERSYKVALSHLNAQQALRDLLGPHQWSLWVWCGYFWVTASNNEKWIVTDSGSIGNVYRQGDDGWWTAYCCHPADISCQAQCAMAQAQAIQTDIKGFLKKANTRGRRSIPELLALSMGENDE